MKNIPKLTLTMIILCKLVLCGSTCAWTQQKHGPGEAIMSVSPATAELGEVGVLVTITLANGAAPPKEVKILNVKIGTLKGKKIERQGSVIKAFFDIPSNAAPGNKSVCVEFPGP
ncbi:MAG: hypothetical protein JRC68_08780, partial [Deltaproteobacteria bacterium]|nr:hypothetical protein [Deltaproteobacteria bacterium]